MIQGFGLASRRVLAGFGRFTPGQKAATICTVLVLAVGGFFFSNWAAKPSYAPLYSNLSGTDASAIVDKLSAGGTPYKLADGGQTVLVPQDKVYDLRLAMSSAGLPAGKDTGYALLDKQGVTTSEFMQHVGYQRALEGELANTISAIDGVSSATVHLAMPQKDVFTDDQQQPTASVLVGTGQGTTLSADQVQAIVHLVSSSVVGLQPNEVTVADATGKVLSAGNGSSTPDSSGGSAGSASSSSLTQAYQQRVSSSLQQMLDQVVGSGHAAVNVTADLNFDQASTKSETYTTDPKLPPLSETSTSETYTGPGFPGTGTAAGVLGPDNIQVPIGGNVASSNTGTSSSSTPTGKYAKTSATRDNAVGVVTRTVQAAPGTVRRLSVAVLLDATTSAKLDKASLEQLVSAAVGLDAKRGDTLAVTSLPFDASAAAAAKSALDSAKKTDQRNQLVSMAKQVGAALIVLLLLFGAWRSSKKKKSVALSDEERAQLEDMQAALEEARTRALTGGGVETPALEAGGGPQGDEDERQARQLELATLVERQPEEVATLLRGWLADKKG
jgi:flagellar M-ring protein FliF